MVQGIHVLGGQSAPQIIRATRVADAREALHLFPCGPLAERRAYLPSQMDEMDVRLQSSEGEADDIPSYWDETLEDVGFPFDEVIVNRKLPPWRLAQLGKATRDNRIELAAFSQADRQGRKTMRAQALSRKLPASAFVQVDSSVYVASPELVCINLARSLETPELAMVIMELTGHWSQEPTGLRGAVPVFALHGLRPVTSLARIRAMADRVPRIYGRKTLEAALDMALEASASRPEAQLALMMRLPIEEGGYGMGTPLLNARIDPPASLRPYLGQRSYYPDLYFQECFADLEYDSLAFHFDPQMLTASDEAGVAEQSLSRKLAADRRRMRDLLTLGVHVIPVTADDLKNARSLDCIAFALAQCISEAGGMSAAAYMEALGQSRAAYAREVLLSRLGKNC